MTLKNSARKTAKKQVNRVVATLALATAAGTAATPAFAADCDVDRDDRGGHGFGHDDAHRAEFGGSERGVEVKADGTVEVHVAAAETVSSVVDVDDILSDVTDSLTDAATSATPSETPSSTPSESPTGTDSSDGSSENSQDGVDDLIGDLVDDLADDVEDGVDDATSDTAVGQDEQDADRGEGGKVPGADRSDQAGGAEKGGAQKGDTAKGDDATGSKSADFWAASAIDYGFDAGKAAVDLEPKEPQQVSDMVDPGGALVAFQATAKSLGYGSDGDSSRHSGFDRADGGDRFGHGGYGDTKHGDNYAGGGHQHTGSWDSDQKVTDYEPRHLRTDSEQGRAPSADAPRAFTDSPEGDRNVLTHVGVGDLRVSLEHSANGVGAEAGIGDLRVNVTAGQGGVSIDADLPGVAQADAGVGPEGVEASVGGDEESGTQTESETVADAGAPADAGTAPSGAADGSGHHSRETMLIADRGAEYTDSGAQYMSNTQVAVDQTGQAAGEAVEQAALDAPLRMATTGAEAATLTGLAGALVAGGAGALFVANRSGRRTPALSPVRPTTNS